MAMSIQKVSKDEFGVVAGSGYVLIEEGERIDWPMLTTYSEAEQDLIEFRKIDKELAAESAAERLFCGER